jgi:U3 small nucleolar RNA-associated protein 19
LDYPNYYKKLYSMIKPKIVRSKDCGKTVELKSVFNMPEKSRFLRLLDLSLRSSVLPTQLIASFLKRLSRIVSSFGACFTTQDIMFVISFSSNLIKRHPKCLRLIHRNSSSVIANMKSDPYKEDEDDPLETRALKSSLWELEALMRQHFDSSVRNYCKVFKTDFLRKTAYFKCEDFTSVNPIDVLGQELDEIDNEKEGEALKKNLMMKHG